MCEKSKTDSLSCALQSFGHSGPINFKIRQTEPNDKCCWEKEKGKEENIRNVVNIKINIQSKGPESEIKIIEYMRLGDGSPPCGYIGNDSIFVNSIYQFIKQKWESDYHDVPYEGTLISASCIMLNQVKNYINQFNIYYTAKYVTITTDGGLSGTSDWVNDFARLPDAPLSSSPYPGFIS